MKTRALLLISIMVLILSGCGISIHIIKSRSLTEIYGEESSGGLGKFIESGLKVKKNEILFQRKAQLIINPDNNENALSYLGFAVLTEDNLYFISYDSEEEKYTNILRTDTRDISNIRLNEYGQVLAVAVRVSGSNYLVVALNKEGTVADRDETRRLHKLLGNLMTY